MIDLQNAVQSLMMLILSGGADAAKGLFTGMVMKEAEQASQLWREVFARQPEAYPLADRVAREPQDQALRDKLSGTVERALRENPELQQRAQVLVTGGIKAEEGSVAAAVISGSTVTINNQ